MAANSILEVSMTNPSFDATFDDLDYWRLCDELSVIEAALLTVGLSPSEYSFVENWNIEKQPRGYQAAKIAIRNALRSGKIKGTVEPEYTSDFNDNAEPIIGSVDLQASRVEVESLKDWLVSRGFHQGFFFPTSHEAPDYLNASNPRFAPKLAAAVRAWLAVKETDGRSPKQALTKWLREHAVAFDLTNEDGTPNETGIEEAAKVANWQPGGGAPKTPGNS
jgi:hypothetical protein